MKILYAVDGSPDSEAAGRLLQRIPFPADAQLVAVSVLEEIPLSVLASEHVAPHVRTAIHKERLGNANALLDASTARMTDSFSHVARQVLDGHVAHELETLAARESADVIVLGARGLNVVERFFLGSTSEKVLRHAPCSILVSHSSADSTSTTFEEESLRILVAFDGSPASLEAVDTLTRLPLKESAEVLLLYSHSIVTLYRQDVIQRLSELWVREQDVVRESISRAAKRLKAVGVRNVSTEVREAEDAASHILDVARDWRADLLMAGDTGKSGMDRFLLGSVCKRLVRHSPCSVWVIRRKRMSAESGM